MKVVGKAITGALTRMPELDEWLDPNYFEQNNWKSWREALLEAHSPVSLDDLKPTAPARKRLAYDELLANQLA